MNDVDDSRWTRRQLALLLLILLLAVGVRAHKAGDRSLWADDYFSIITSNGHGNPQRFAEGLLPAIPDLVSLDRAAPAHHVWTRQDRDVHPPIYFLSLRFWRQAFGESEAALRSLSIVCSVIAILGLFCAVRTSLGATPALWAAAILAVAYHHVGQAREVRQYSMVVMWATLALWVFARIDRLGLTRRRGAALALLVWLMAETHYFFVGVALAMAVFALIYFRGRQRWWTIGCFAVAGGLFLITAGPFLRGQMQLLQTTTVWLSDSETHHAWRSIQRALTLPATLLMAAPKPLQPLLPIAGLLFFAPLIVPSTHRRPIMLWWLVAVCVIGIVAFSDLTRSTRQLELPRYTLLAAPALAAMVAGVFAHRRFRPVLPAVVFIACLWTVRTTYEPHRSAWANLNRESARQLAGHVQPGDAIVFATESRRQWYAHILAANYHRYGGTGDDVRYAMAYVPAITDLPAQLAAHRCVWVYSPGDLPTQSYLPTHQAERVLRFGTFATVTELVREP